MKVFDFLKGMIIVTVLAVMYIHLQMKIYDLAYQTRGAHKNIERLAEVNSRVRNDIARLRSSDHIGRELLAEDTQYQFASRRHIVEVATDRPALPERIALRAHPTGDLFARFISIALAE